jgi:hypothetical protein
MAEATDFGTDEIQVFHPWGKTLPRLTCHLIRITTISPLWLERVRTIGSWLHSTTLAESNPACAPNWEQLFMRLI